MCLQSLSCHSNVAFARSEEKSTSGTDEDALSSNDIFSSILKLSLTFVLSLQSDLAGMFQPVS